MSLPEVVVTGAVLFVFAFFYATWRALIERVMRTVVGDVVRWLALAVAVWAGLSLFLL